MHKWQERVIAEELELAVKIKKLLEYLASYDGINLPEIEQNLLKLQINMMKAYQSILKARIVLITKTTIGN